MIGTYDNYKLDYNLTLSDLYQHVGYSINIIDQHLVKEINRKSPKYYFSYDTIFVDYDDTFEYIKDVLNNKDKYAEKSMMLKEFTSNQNKMYFEKLERLIIED